MAQRIAAATALIAFLVCLVAGAWQADNPFNVSVMRALLAMLATFVIGLIVGSMGARLIDESVADHKKILQARSRSAADDR